MKWTFKFSKQVTGDGETFDSVWLIKKKKKSVTLIMLRAGYGETRQKNYSSYMMLKEVVILS